ncbi:MAG: polyprenyl synthetase family protein [Leadbetterella sp.]
MFKKNPLLSFSNSTFRDILETLEEEIRRHSFGKNPVELYQPIDYIMSLGGKRMRPAATLLSASLWDADFRKFLMPALAIEVFHNFTLMHDDIMDNAPSRRGKPTVHQKWNNNTAILSGDVMLVCAYQLYENLEAGLFQRTIKRFSKTAAEVCEGQQLDMMFATKETVSKEEYVEMIRLKTSVLLGFALEQGAILAGADEKSIQLMYEIGENVGLGFQLYDDILDVYADPEKFGKQVGGDIIENKRTWLLLDALEQSNGTSLHRDLRKLMALDDSQAIDKIQGVKDVFSKLNIQNRATDYADTFFEKAYLNITLLDIDEDKKETLKSFVSTIQNRQS